MPKPLKYRKTIEYPAQKYKKETNRQNIPTTKKNFALRGTKIQL